MTARYDDDRLLRAWLHDIAATREPEHLLGQVLARTARTRRRAAWRIPERWFSMSAITSRLAPAPQLPWRLLSLALLLVALLVAGLLIYAGSPRPAPPFGPAANGSLYFSDFGDIYAQAGPAGERVAIVAGPELDTDPILAPDGTKLAFLRHLEGDAADIWVVNADGSDLRRLDVGGPIPGWFEWLPDGRAAAIVTDAAPTVLVIASLDGKPRTFDLGVGIQEVAPRPGHLDQLAFIGTAPGGERGIYLVKTDGTGMVRLELDPGFQSDPAYAVDKDYYFWEMRWSPTGDRLLYTTLEPAPASPEGAGFRVHLATVDAAGSVGQDRVLEFAPETDDEFQPAWLPTGDGLVFESLDRGQHWLSVAQLTGGAPGTPRRLDVQRNDWIGVQISPDGRYALGRIPSVVQIDLARGTFERLTVGVDVSWQRLAP